MHELLKYSPANKEDYSQIWKRANLEQRARWFRVWLENLDDTLIIVDEVDSVESTRISPWLPRESKCLVLSTRNPDFIAHNQFTPYLLSPMKSSATIGFLRRELDSLNCSYLDHELEDMAELLGNHPLAIAQAVSWISDQLLLVSRLQRPPTSKLIKLLTGSEHTERLGFLEHASHHPQTSVSIMDTYSKWKLRLPEPAFMDDSLIDFCSLVGFLDVEHSKFDFRHFLEFRGDELDAEHAREAFPDYGLFTLTDSELISKQKILRSVSMLRVDAAPLRLHRIWKECIRQSVGAEGRIRFTRQILRICHTMTVKHKVIRPGAHPEDWLPWVDECLDVIEQFAIPFDSLSLRSDAMDYVKRHQSERRSILKFCVDCKTAKSRLLRGRAEENPTESVEAHHDMRTSARALRQDFLALRELVEGYFSRQEGARIHAALEDIKLLASTGNLEEKSSLEEQLTRAQERIAVAREQTPHHPNEGVHVPTNRFS